MYNIHEIVQKLVGPIDPVGETNADKKRLENLKVMTQLVDKLLCDINWVSGNNAVRVEHSRKVAGQHASKFIEAIKEEY